MLFNPGVLALVSSSVLLSAITTLALIVGAGVMVNWDPTDGGERQLQKERRLFLVETTMKLVLWLELFSLFLFIAIADRIHSLLSGAMCAAGTFNASPFGYPALGAKMAAFGLCGVWLILNRASGVAGSVGLVRFKQVFLSVIWGVLLLEGWLQFRFFSGLNPDILTSCCSTMFNVGAAGAASTIATVPVWASVATLLFLFPITLGTGLWVIFRGISPFAFSIFSGLLGLASGTAVVTWVAPAYYQLPTHHCPFCLLAPNVNWVGYPIMGSLSLAVITGIGAGIVRTARSLDPQDYFKPNEENRLCLVSIAAFSIFITFAIWPMVRSGLRLEVI